LKGFGWICCPGYTDFYLHISQCADERTPRIGEEVTFTPAPPTRGKKWEAADVEFLTPTETIETNGTNGTNDDNQR
jgi:hypothetical protein